MGFADAFGYTHRIIGDYSLVFFANATRVQFHPNIVYSAASTVRMQTNIFRIITDVLSGITNIAKFRVSITANSNERDEKGFDERSNLIECVIGFAS